MRAAIRASCGASIIAECSLAESDAVPTSPQSNDVVGKNEGSKGP